MEFMKRKNTPARDPKECRWQEVNVLETSNRRYRTGTNEVRHYYRNCSSRTFQVDLHSTQRSSQDLHTRTSYRHPRRTFIQAPTHRIIKILMQGPPSGRISTEYRISTRSSQGPAPDHVRTPKGFKQDIFKSFSQGPVQDHPKASGSISLGSPQDLRTRICKKDLGARESHKIVIKGPAAAVARSHQILIQEPPKSLAQELSYKHL